MHAKGSIQIQVTVLRLAVNKSGISFRAENDRKLDTCRSITSNISWEWIWD
jgi:hypothetical protein